MMRPRLSMASLLLFSLAAVSQAAEDTKIKTAHDVTYTKAGDRELKLDIAEPAEGDGPFPAVVFIHGGGWAAGDKSSYRPLLDVLAKHGYVAISVQYRFAPDDVFPAQIHDVKAAVRWLRAHAKEHKVDVERIGATGGSAGGHLALLLGVTDADDGLEGDVEKDAPSSRVQAVVNFFGPTDLLAKDIPPVSQGILKKFLGGTVDEKTDLAKQASPLTYVTKDDPPILTFQGTKDPLVPGSQAVYLGAAMTRAEVPGRVEFLIGAGHGWGGEEMERTVKEMIEFFDQHLKPKN
jgi:acetyl esterase/lipase